MRYEKGTDLGTGNDINDYFCSARRYIIAIKQVLPLMSLSAIIMPHVKLILYKHSSEMFDHYLVKGCWNWPCLFSTLETRFLWQLKLQAQCLSYNHKQSFVEKLAIIFTRWFYFNILIHRIRFYTAYVQYWIVAFGKMAQLLKRNFNVQLVTRDDVVSCIIFTPIWGENWKQPQLAQH